MNRFVAPALIGAAALAAGFAGFWFGQSRSPTAALTAPNVAMAGAPLPALPLVDLDGKPYVVPGTTGQRVLLNFWATWCPPCLEEIPLLNEVAASQPDLLVIGIAVDDPAAVRKFLGEHRIDYPVVLVEDPFDDPSRQLGNTMAALPFSVLVDAGGKIRRTKLGELKPGEIEAFLAP